MMHTTKHGWTGSRIQLKNTPYLSRSGGLKPGMQGTVIEAKDAGHPFREEIDRLVRFDDFDGEDRVIAEGLFHIIEDVSYPAGQEYSKEQLEKFRLHDPDR